MGFLENSLMKYLLLLVNVFMLDLNNTLIFLIYMLKFLICSSSVSSSILSKRTSTVLLETLIKSRNQGKQVIQVQHVTVNEGGQAMVGQASH
jgi:hypothetical protein